MNPSEDYESIVTAVDKVEFVCRALESHVDLSIHARGGVVCVLDDAIAEIREALGRLLEEA